MNSLAIALLAGVVALSARNSQVAACGLPMPPPMMSPCCAPAAPLPCPPPPPCGCGRKKREAVEIVPHLKTEELACPQEGWKSLIEPQMGADATSSAFAIQSALYTKFDAKFFVSCSPANAEKPTRLAAHGDAFCIVKSNDLICQVIAISA